MKTFNKNYDYFNHNENIKQMPKQAKNNFVTHSKILANIWIKITYELKNLCMN